MSKNTIKLVLCLVATVATVALPATAQAPYEGRGTLLGGNPTEPVAGGPIDCNNPDNPVVNCGFEDMLNSWVPVDIAGPFIAMQTIGAGYTNGFSSFATTPTEGSFVVINGFDGTGPGTIELGQDISVPMGSTGTLTFDYRGAWDLQTFGATIDRTFEVSIEPTGGGASMQTDLILTATAGTVVNDTGAMTGMVDLTSFTGQDVRVNFVWNIPEVNTGPAFFQVDNVNVAVEAGGGAPIPTLGFYGIALLAALLMLVGFRFLNRGA